MTEELPPIPTVQELLGFMETSWQALQATVDAASTDDLVSKTDAAGWSSSDHLVNLDAWAKSVLVMIRDGQPQWEGLGISQALFDEDDYDRKNEAIREQHASTSPEEVRSSLANTHDAMVHAVAGLGDDGLHRPCNDFVPGSGDFEIAHKIMGNGYMHYDEHRVYIERILAS
jgi:hypothetical protein